MRRFFLAAAAFLGIFGDAVLPSARADVVLPGYDLFETTGDTTFGGVAFQGVPLGTFNFGGTIGVQNTGAISGATLPRGDFRRHPPQAAKRPICGATSRSGNGRRRTGCASSGSAASGRNVIWS
jgi:hypothetical protein